MKKFVSLIVLAAIMAFAGAAFAAFEGETYIAEQSVSNHTVSVSGMPSDARMRALTPHAPIAVPDESGKTITFTRGAGYKEGIYKYEVLDVAAGDAVAGTWTLRVLDVTKAASLADTAVKAGVSSTKDIAIYLRNGFSFSDEPAEPPAWETPNSACGIGSIAFYDSDPRYEVTADGSFTAGVAKITMNGVVKYNDTLIEGAKDSGTLGTCYFVVSDYEVSAASATWAMGGALKPVEFTIETADAVTAVKLYDGVNPKDSTVKVTELKAADYTAAKGTANTAFTLKTDLLKTLSAGDKTLEITMGDSSNKVYFVLKVVTGADPSKNVAMSIVPNKVALGDSIVAELDAVEMEQIKAVRFAGADITPVSSFASRKDENGTVIGSTVYLPSSLTVALDETKTYSVIVVYDLGAGEKEISADFTVTRETNTKVPSTAVSPDADLRSQIPAAVSVDFGGDQSTATLFEVEYALKDSVGTKKTSEYFGADGKLTGVAARALIDADENLTPLPTVSTYVQKGHVAPVTFIVRADQLVSGDHTINWADAHVYKVVADGSELKSEWLSPARTMAEVADGKFQIFDLKGDKLAAEIRKSGGIDQSYRLVVYVKDNGSYDLNGRDNYVLDPVVLGARLPASSGGSGGTCSAGMGLAAAVAAALVLRRRGK